MHRDLDEFTKMATLAAKQRVVPRRLRLVTDNSREAFLRVWLHNGGAGVASRVVVDVMENY